MRNFFRLLKIAAGIALLVACAPIEAPGGEIGLPQLPETTPGGPTATPLPERPFFKPGEIVSYTAQTGDTLPALAAHFNTPVEEILRANPIVPADVSTLPPGLPMEIPIVYRNYWGTSFKILPDSYYVNGPQAVAFNTAEFVTDSSGWLAAYREYADDDNRTGAEIVALVARDFSISPRLLLALTEYLAGGLSQPTLPQDQVEFPLGYRSYRYKGYYLQLVWVANKLNNGYYGWRSGELIEFELADGTLERPDPWQNAATVAIQHVFKDLLPTEQYHHAISPAGFAQTFYSLYGNPWENEEPHIPGSLTQPDLLLPFPAGERWDFTGGPHTAWGSGTPFAALDFAPPSTNSGCFISTQWTTAVADGIIVRAKPSELVLDLDMDGDERTGWVVFYLHISGQEQTNAGTVVQAGDPLGHTSCEGGSATGSHIHIARKYNGEWVIADSPVPFVMENWLPRAGKNAYEGTLVRFEESVTACVCADVASSLLATGSPDGILKEGLIEEPPAIEATQ